MRTREDRAEHEEPDGHDQWDGRRADDGVAAAARDPERRHDEQRGERQDRDRDETRAEQAAPSAPFGPRSSVVIG